MKFTSPDKVIEHLLKQSYVCTREVALTVFLSHKLQKPVLVEGPAGVGKTELAKAIALALGNELIRLQCYEGLDETKALYEWEYGKQLLYTQMLREKIHTLIDKEKSLADAVKKIASQENVFFSKDFLIARPLLLAIQSEKPVVLLVDEVDRSDPEFEAFLLEILSDFQVSVPEIGTIKARHIPFVVLTSNNTREISDALKRRCLHLFMGYPDKEQENEIIKRKVPEAETALRENIVQLMQSVRGLDLKKKPGLSETLDWAKALVLLNENGLSQENVQDTLNVILKHQEDIGRAKKEVERFFARKNS